MIISCNNCSKKFEVNSDLIPAKGRLLQCSACNYEWFFKGLMPTKTIKADKVTNPTSPDDNLIKKKEEVSRQSDLNDQQPSSKEDLKDDVKKRKSFTNIKKKERKKFKILNIIIVFIISFIAFILLIDTFKYPISKIIPNIEFILYSLYESIKDIVSFFKDLI